MNFYSRLLPTIYLVGAIRDGVTADITWREQVIGAVSSLATILNPLADRRFDAERGRWSFTGGEPDGRHIVAHDFWCVDRADIIIANLTALGDKYPNIGSLLELGRSTARAPLRYLILPEGYTGHNNNVSLFALHPFLDRIASHVFSSVDALIAFLPAKLAVLSGKTPNFGGVQ